ncbi:hypothetical protein [Cohnella lupini]|uniref:Uncharacterized protein n=1 Tax=Cohnella lupini TaxID=1294267 RepID=A0A3D9IFN4_9BACL|nr:hypothetical protein [Cohnella lupini]RED60485.1 hypothetical protein DFP95_106277 [Cohnella lupini]
MKEGIDSTASSSVWNRYRAAKQTAFGIPEESEAAQTLEELEAAIAEAAASSGLPEIGLPPRAGVHTVKRRQLSRWYYLALVLLFSGLVIGLFWWGREHHNG